MTDQIYLDNCATTKMAAEVASAMDDANRSGIANPASQHQSGQRSRRVVEAAREEIINLLGGSTSGMTADRLILTSGGTESNNLVLRGLTANSTNANIVVSAIEHPSIIETARALGRLGIEIRQLPVDQSGVVKVDQLEDLCDKNTRVVSVMLGNHETGAMQPITEIAQIARQRGAFVHCDAVQAIGKIPVSFQELSVDALSFSAHKIHGPVGIGGLLLRHDLTLEPMMTGGFQQQGIRPGTESVALALGAALAVRLAVEQVATTESCLRRMRESFEQKLQAELPALVINAADARRLPHVSNISAPGLDRQAILLALDMAGIACSTGSACASGSSEPSPVLEAMELEKSVVEGAIRFSLSRLTTAAEIDIAVERILRVYNGLQQA